MALFVASSQRYILPEIVSLKSRPLLLVHRGPSGHWKPEATSSASRDAKMASHFASSPTSSIAQKACLSSALSARRSPRRLMAIFVAAIFSEFLKLA